MMGIDQSSYMVRVGAAEFELEVAADDAEVAAGFAQHRRHVVDRRVLLLLLLLPRPPLPHLCHSGVSGALSSGSCFDL